ncbi:TPA: serine kinase [Xanthomonas vasicola pv. zeae]|nr:HrpE family protein [Xanthomonas vasicola]MBV6744638.1 serine kinase [Xanthomonas vasicola pv. vasculorum NCPPB 890]MBV6890251.1 serine kinase [Xanthomonas vasicola pv. vasculorum]MBV7303207.1 serine kinase [Xanthomonas vasicola pv. vasculorum]MDO6932727.1 HrpE family protein [Xanthomonas vasicola]MDO6937318.1 HrpE family protein [Xanthomonas vasicola]
MEIFPQASALNSRFGQGFDGLTGGISNGMSGASGLAAQNQQIGSLIGDLTASDEAQKGMNNAITKLKNDLDFNVALNKFVGKAGDNAKQLVGQ